MGTIKAKTKQKLKSDLAEVARTAEEKEYEAMLDKAYNANIRAGIPQINPENEDITDTGTPTYIKMGLSIQEAVQIFLDHRYMSRKTLAEKYGSEKWFYMVKQKPQNVIQRIYQDIVRKPERYAEFITEDDIKETAALVVSRTGSNDLPAMYGNVKSVKAVVAKPVADMLGKFNKLLDKSANIADLKLDSIKSKKDIKDMDIKKVMEVVKMASELKRLESGEATQHVAHIIKQNDIDKMDVGELIEVLAQQKDHS